MSGVFGSLFQPRASLSSLSSSVCNVAGRSRSRSRSPSGSKVSPLRIAVLPFRWMSRKKDRLMSLPSSPQRGPLIRMGRYNTPSVLSRTISRRLQSRISSRGSVRVSPSYRAFVNLVPDINPLRVITDFYDVSTVVLGEGHFGSVVSAIHKDTGTKFAVKIISKHKVRDTGMIRSEVEIVQTMRHPDIVEVVDVFEDPERVYLVMDYCPGGELFDRIATRGRFSEADAAQIMHKIFRAVHYCHENGVAHRDLKPENFLLASADSDVDVKLIDFGLACRTKSGEILRARVGTPYYIAPEVLFKEYDIRADLWSCGVIMYILLAGYPPFHGDNDTDIFRRIRRGKFSFPDLEWSSVSSAAKELVTGLLNMNISRRTTCAEALAHPWIVCEGKGQMHPHGPWLIASMRRFGAYHRLKQLGLHLVSRLLDKHSPGCRLIKQSFDHFDENGDGEISKEEIVSGMVDMGLEVDDKSATLVMEGADLNGDGALQYEEFAAVVMQRSLYLNAEYLDKVFNLLDVGGDGMIGLEDLTMVLGARLAGEVMAEADRDGDGCIEYQEFLLAMCGDEDDH